MKTDIFQEIEDIIFSNRAGVQERRKAPLIPRYDNQTKKAILSEIDVYLKFDKYKGRKGKGK